MSSLWILERESKEAGPSGPSYWLLPGFCRVGRQPPAEVLVAGDKSISRVHAEITVPQLEEWEAAGGRPYIRLKGGRQGADTARGGRAAHHGAALNSSLQT